jgi:hypothetical protein
LAGGEVVTSSNPSSGLSNVDTVKLVCRDFRQL